MVTKKIGEQNKVRNKNEISTRKNFIKKLHFFRALNITVIIKNIGNVKVNIISIINKIILCL